MGSKYKRKGGAKFVKITEFMMLSEAWKNLKPNDRSIYLELKRRYDGFNNGRIAFAVRDGGKSAGVCKNAASKSLKRLETLGFIRIQAQSGFNRKNRIATEYVLTEEKNNVTGEIASKDFMRWRP